MLARVLCRSSHDETTHGGDDCLTYVVEMFAIYGLVEVIDQKEFQIMETYTDGLCDIEVKAGIMSILDVGAGSTLRQWQFGSLGDRWLLGWRIIKVDNEFEWGRM